MKLWSLHCANGPRLKHSNEMDLYSSLYFISVNTWYIVLNDSRTPFFIIHSSSVTASVSLACPTELTAYSLEPATDLEHSGCVQEEEQQEAGDAD